MHRKTGFRRMSGELGFVHARSQQYKILIEAALRSPLAHEFFHAHHTTYRLIDGEHVLFDRDSWKIPPEGVEGLGGWTPLWRSTIPYSLEPRIEKLFEDAAMRFSTKPHPEYLREHSSTK